jgi:hypothetical protein
MDIKTIDSEKMKSLKALADANIAVSTVKGTLAKLKTDQHEYLKEREVKAIKQVQAVLDESQTVLKDAFANYVAVNELGREVSELSTFITEAYTDFLELKGLFDEMTSEWEASVESTKKELEETKKQILIDRAHIEKDKEEVAKSWKLVATARRKNKDERETLERAIIRLKEGKI